MAIDLHSSFSVENELSLAFKGNRESCFCMSEVSLNV